MIRVQALSLPTVEILSATVPCGWQNKPARMLVSSRYRSAMPGASHQRAAGVCVQIRRRYLQRFWCGEQGKWSLLSERFHHQMMAVTQLPAAPVA